MKDLLTVYRRIYRDKGENGMPIERRTYCQPGASMAFLLLRVPSLGDVFVIKPIKNRHAVKFTCGVRSLNLPRGQATGTPPSVAPIDVIGDRALRCATAVWSTRPSLRIG